jgi:hypothetical protein
LDSSWIGVSPLQRAWRYGRVPFPHWQAWQHPNMFCSATLVRPGCEAEFWTALLEGLDHDGGWPQALRLTDLALDDVLTAALLEVCLAQGRATKIDRERSRSMLPADETGLDWQAGLKPDARRRITALERKLAAEHGEVTLQTHRGAAVDSGLIEQFLDLEQSGWKGNSGSALGCDAGNAAFLRDMTRFAALAGAIEVAVLMVGQRTAAMSLHFINESGWGHGFKSAFAEDLAAFAPGVLLLAQLTGHFRLSGQLPFDSCSAPEQLPIGKLWPRRREFIDCGVALSGSGARIALRGLQFCEELAHRRPGRAVSKA